MNTTEITIAKAKRIPGSQTTQYNVDVNGAPFGAVIQNGKGSVWLCAPLDGDTTQHAKLADAKVAMMDLIEAAHKGVA